jgi:hypothetical protein
LLPYIVKSLRTVEDITDPHKPIIVDIRPEHGIILIRRFKGKEVIVADFVPPYLFDQMREKAYNYKPDNFTLEEYNNHVAMAVEKAKKIYRAEWCKNPINIRQRKKQCHACALLPPCPAKEQVALSRTKTPA